MMKNREREHCKKWTDNDDEVTYLPFLKKENTGAESAHYRALDHLQIPRNKPLDCCAELLQVRGISLSVYLRLQDHLTVKGEGQIDINSASKLILQCISHEMDPAVAQIIIDRRKTKPFANLQELRNLPGMTATLYGVICKTATVAPTSEYYHVRLTGAADAVQHEAQALLRQNTNTRNVDVIHYVEI